MTCMTGIREALTIWFSSTDSFILYSTQECAMSRQTLSFPTKCRLISSYNGYFASKIYL